MLPTHYLFDKWYAEGLQCKIFNEETVEYIKTVEYFLTLDFIIETFIAKDETWDIWNVEEHWQKQGILDKT